MNGRRLSSWMLVGVAIFVVLGHVCALPVHAHAGAVTTADHPERGSDEAAHGGSCEALRASPNLDVPALLPTGVAPLVIGSLETHSAHATSAPTPASSRPLFLLHAVLLI